LFVFTFALLGAGLILFTVGGQLSASEQALTEQRAEKALTQFDSKAALVALGNTDTQTISFPQSGNNDITVENGTGWMRITIDNQSDGSGSKTLVNKSLGSVVYESGQTKIAYQGGGVFQRNGNNSAMVSPPEFHFRNGTLTLPIVNVSGTASIDDDATITHEKTTKEFPDRDLSKSFVNPLTEHEVTVTVKSEYYKGWGSYFEERTEGRVNYDHSRNLVNLTLVTPLNKNTLTSATASLSASGDFIISGSAAKDCNNNKEYTNSYNSSKDPYCSQSPGDEGDVVYGGTVDIAGGAGTSNINGDIVAGGTVYVSGSNGQGQPSVYGNINYTVSCVASGGNNNNNNNNNNGGGNGDCTDRIEDPHGELNQINGVPSSAAIDSIVDTTIYDVRADPDNNDTGAIDGDKIDYSGGSATLTAGSYYLDNIDFDGGSASSLELNTNGGDITLAVRGDVDMPSSTEIDVTGPNTVRMYVGGESALSDGDGWTWEMNNDAEVNVVGDKSPQFRVYGKQDFEFKLDTGKDAGFTGAIFAPPGASGSGEVDLRSGHIYGGVLTGTTEISNQGSIHYDEALENTTVVSRSARIVKVTYLHVSTNQIEVTD
jgi:hypothetical protein